MTAVKKASQSCHREWEGLDEVVTVAIICTAVSVAVADADVEERVWRSEEKGFEGLVPGTSKIVVISVNCAWK